MKQWNNLKKTTRTDFVTYLAVTLTFLIVLILQSRGMVNRSISGMLVPICCYVSMAVSLNLVVGVSGELSLGHAGFMSVGAFSGVIAAMSLKAAIPAGLPRLVIAMIVGGLFAAVAGLLIGIPVLRLRGDYLAIVTLAFGEIIKELINCLLVGFDSRGLHIVFNITGSMTINDLRLDETGLAIIKGAQGATGTDKLASFPVGFVLVMLSLVVVLNLVRSRTGRAIMATRDNRIAAESVGINVSKYKMTAFVTSAALAGMAGALYGLNYSNMSASKFDYNTSILVLVYVVLGGLGNIRGSVIAAVVLYILPEALREFADFRMLVYAIVMILVMLATNNAAVKGFFARIFRRDSEEKGGAAS